jgi:hypothetical protein
MKKGIAVETLMKLLIYMIAAGVVIFLIYRYVLGSGLSERGCATRMTAWCVQCQIAEFAGGPPMDDKLKECIDKNYLPGISKRDNCKGAEKDCEGFLPVS